MLNILLKRSILDLRITDHTLFQYFLVSLPTPLLNSLQNSEYIIDHNEFTIAGGPRPGRNRIRMYPYLNALIAIRPYHLPTDLHPPVDPGKLHKSLHDAYFFQSPCVRLTDPRLQMYLIRVHMVYTLMVLVVEEDPADVRVCLLHPRFE